MTITVTNLPIYYETSAGDEWGSFPILAEKYGQLARVVPMRRPQPPYPLTASDVRVTDFVQLDRGVGYPVRVSVSDFIKCLRRIDAEEQEARVASLPKAKSVVTPSPMFNREIDID